MANRRMNQRRRRVVLEEVTQSARHATDPRESAVPTPNPEAPVDAKTKAYTASAHRRHQKKTTDLFPKRYRALVLLLLLLIGSVWGLNGLSTYSPQWQDTLTASQLQAFALSGNGSLSSWFASFLLVLSGLASLQIYALRQHRCDDYRGTYRLWAWLAALFMLGSINCVVDLTGLLHSVTAALIGTDPGNGLVWLVTVKLLVLSLLVVRGIFEIRASVGALVGVVIVWIAYSSAVVLQIPAVKENLVQDSQFYYGNCLLIGSCSVFMSIVQYARFVFLHSNGLLESEVPQKAKQKKPAVVKEVKKKSPRKSVEAPVPTSPAPVAAVKKERVQPSPVESSNQPVFQAAKKPSKNSQSKTPLGSRIKSKPAASNDFSFDLEQDEIEMFHLLEKEDLSKSERRRLRKLQKRQNRAA